MQEPATFNFSATAHVPGALVLTLDPPEEVDLAGCAVRETLVTRGAQAPAVIRDTGATARMKR